MIKINIAELRSLVWRRMKKKSTQRLPPDEDTLRLHIQRCNYVIFMNLHYSSPCAIESPSYHGWISEDGLCSKAIPETCSTTINDCSSS